MLVIRPEAPEDVDIIGCINEQAFSQENEAKLIEMLRNRGVLMISLVATRYLFIIKKMV